MQLSSKPTQDGWDIEITLPDGRVIGLGLDYYLNEFQLVLDHPSEDEAQVVVKYDAKGIVSEIRHADTISAFPTP